MKLDEILKQKAPLQAKCGTILDSKGYQLSRYELRAVAAAANVLPGLVDEIKSKECPWPQSVWPFTIKEYIKAVPDEHLRTAISGFLMREGWLIARKELKDALERAEEVSDL